MIAFVLIAIVFIALFAKLWLPMLLLAVSALVSIRLLATGKRVAGSVILAAAGTVAAINWLLPAYFDGSFEGTDPRHPPVAKAMSVGFPVDLVIQGIGDNPASEVLRDAMTLAETGLFRVSLAGMNPDGTPHGGMTLVRSGDCVLGLGAGSQKAVRVGALAFTARTGFGTCAVYGRFDGPLPARRLELWLSHPYGAVRPVRAGTLQDDGYRGSMILTLYDGVREVAQARRDSYARRSTGFRLAGVNVYDDAPEGGRSGRFKPYDPGPSGLRARGPGCG